MKPLRPHMLSCTQFVITPNGLGIASCQALALKQGEISAEQPETGRSNFTCWDTLNHHSVKYAFLPCSALAVFCGRVK